MLLSSILFISIALALTLAWRPSLGGKPFAFAALCVLPVSGALLGVSAHVERSKSTEFCVSCHVMSKHGRSLKVDDTTLLVAAHYQSGAVPRDRACFTCHTTYTMYGDFAAKLRGVKHVWVNYFGKPGKLALYEPYHNRECLHCHADTRRFLKGTSHQGRFDAIRANTQSCIAKGCHEFVHATDEVDTLPLWNPGGAS